MKILIIKNGKCKTFINKIIKNIDSNIVFEIVQNIDLDKIIYLPDAVIILGGMISVIDLNKDIKLQKVINFIEVCEKQNIPVLGICLGCQLIAKYFGCKIEKNSKPVYGFQDIQILESDNISEIIRRNNFLYLSLHNDHIVESKNIKIMAISNSYPYYIKKNMFIGLQFHPDVIADNIDNFMKCFCPDKDKKNISNYFSINKEKIFNASLELFREWIKNL